jgi:hypothetical protein
MMKRMQRDKCEIISYNNFSDLTIFGSCLIYKIRQQNPLDCVKLYTTSLIACKSRKFYTNIRYNNHMIYLLKTSIKNIEKYNISFEKNSIYLIYCLKSYPLFDPHLLKIIKQYHSRC